MEEGGQLEFHFTLAQGDSRSILPCMKAADVSFHPVFYLDKK
jgi:hypothetical protein